MKATALSPSDRMKRVRSKDTEPELVVRKLLRDLGYYYRLHGAGLPGTPDIWFKTKKKAIFVNGCYWHFHQCRLSSVPKTNSKFWLEKFNANVRRDLRKKCQLEALGWKVLVIWQCEIRNKVALEENLRIFLG